MNTSTFQNLQAIHHKFGPGIFGKIAQKLLALALYESGFSHIVERGVQGVDIDAATAGATKYALEVKTTEKDSVPISRENIDALGDRVKDGYVPLIAALRIQMFEDWVFAAVPLSQLQPGPLHLSRLRSYRLRDLEASVCPTFQRVVDQHFNGILKQGEHYLIGILAQKRVGRISE